MFSALSPKYPGLHDEDSGVLFQRGKAAVTEEQAFALAKRRYVDGILIGEFDEEGRTINAMPAKDWAKIRRRDEPGDAPRLPDSTDAGEPAEKNTRSK